jgi:hypothetical protein
VLGLQRIRLCLSWKIITSGQVIRSYEQREVNTAKFVNISQAKSIAFVMAKETGKSQKELTTP